ncbi:hypothetical protein J2W55_004692 [Mucilaginibacter pocheonensis]|uniref:Uncharacterized protein n=1 Tax=Mucilaginibacter pocheonensis TaxID=398050 RepID=A0ABU1THE3_9SPHI|nr:hypothetical protein [Mucilaginibacter pocheonensis]
MTRGVNCDDAREGNDRLFILLSKNPKVQRPQPHNPQNYPSAFVLNKNTADSPNITWSPSLMG